MKNRIAVVTGGLGTLGTAICKALCRGKAHVIATYHREGDHASARRWQTTMQKMGYEMGIQYMDITDFGLCAHMMMEIEKMHGEIDILVNNAGISRDIPLCRMQPEQWQAVIRINLDGLFNVTRQVINGMLERGYGRIINIAASGNPESLGQANYAASKAGVHGFTASLAEEVAARGITVNSISPGWIETASFLEMPANLRKKIISQIPAGRPGRAEEIARAVVFLAAEESAFITGSHIAIHGGQRFF